MKDYYTSEGINASTLKYFAGDYFSPTQALYKMRNPFEPTQAMSLGTAVHSILEHEMNTDEAYEVIAGAYKTEKARAPQMNKACAMANNVWETCKDVVQSPNAIRERAHFVGEFKALIDLEVDGVGYDYKTTRVTTLDECRREAHKYHLEVQAYHYCTFGNFKGFEFIFVSSVEPHQVFRLKCSQEYLQDFAKPRWEQALERYYKYKDMDIPLIEDDTLDIPSWYEKEVFA